MHTYEIVDVTKETVQADNSRLLVVKMNILDEKGNAVESRKLGFPLDIEKEELEKELQKACDTYASDLLVAEKVKKLEEAEKHSDELIKELTNNGEVQEE